MGKNNYQPNSGKPLDTIIDPIMGCPKCGEDWDIKQTDQVHVIYWQCNQCLYKWSTEKEEHDD